MQHYELLSVLSIKLNEEEQKKAVEKVIDLIKKEGGQVTKNEDWGRRKLAYQIKHERHGFYLLLEFDLMPNKLSVISKFLKLTPEILRYMMVQAKIRTEEEIAKERRIKERRIAEEEKKLKEKIAAEEKPVEKKPAKEKKISLEDLDKKLDEILKEDVIEE